MTEYDPDFREGEPGDDDCRIERIEIDFAIPVWLSSEQQMELANLVQEIAKRLCNTPRGGVHWSFGMGAKPKFSQADQRFLGKLVDPDAPESGEPEFDNSVLYFETAARAR